MLHQLPRDCKTCTDQERIILVPLKSRWRTAAGVCMLRQLHTGIPVRFARATTSETSKPSMQHMVLTCSRTRELDLQMQSLAMALQPKMAHLRFQMSQRSHLTQLNKWSARRRLYFSGNRNGCCDDVNWQCTRLVKNGTTMQSCLHMLNLRQLGTNLLRC